MKFKISRVIGRMGTMNVEWFKNGPIYEHMLDGTREMSQLAITWMAPMRH